MDGLCDCYFIGGEWDGVRKRTSGKSTITVPKTKIIQHKIDHYFLKEDTVSTTTDYEEDVYWRVTFFSDGVTVYRLREDLTDVDTDDYFMEAVRKQTAAAMNRR